MKKFVVLSTLLLFACSSSKDIKPGQVWYKNSGHPFSNLNRTKLVLAVHKDNIRDWDWVKYKYIWDTSKSDVYEDSDVDSWFTADSKLLRMATHQDSIDFGLISGAASRWLTSHDTLTIQDPSKLSFTGTCNDSNLFNFCYQAEQGLLFYTGANYNHSGRAKYNVKTGILTIYLSHNRWEKFKIEEDGFRFYGSKSLDGDSLIILH